jgi:hypothetical protein
MMHCTSTETNISNMNIKSSEKGIKDVNKDFEMLLQLNVCLLCDSFVSPFDAEYISVDKLLDEKFKANLQRCISITNAAEGDTRFEPLPDAVNSYYTYRGRFFGKELSRKEKAEINKMLLSPRGKYYNGETQTKTGFLICRSCQRGVKTKKMPNYAIANNFYVGSPPACLLELTRSVNPFLSTRISRDNSFPRTVHVALGRTSRNHETTEHTRRPTPTMDGCLALFLL